jgi:hypothetical protein
MNPTLARTRGGWAAIGRWFATHGATYDEAIVALQHHEKKIAEILSRPRNWCAKTNRKAPAKSTDAANSLIEFTRHLLNVPKSEVDAIRKATRKKR